MIRSIKIALGTTISLLVAGTLLFFRSKKATQGKQKPRLRWKNMSYSIKDKKEKKLDKTFKAKKTCTALSTYNPTSSGSILVPDMLEYPLHSPNGIVAIQQEKEQYTAGSYLLFFAPMLKMYITRTTQQLTRAIQCSKKRKSIANMAISY